MIVGINMRTIKKITFKKIIFYFTLLCPLIYLGYLVALSLLVLFTLKQFNHSGPIEKTGISNQLKYFVTTKILKPAYFDTRNIYQGLSDCAEHDIELTYIPKDDSNCIFNNLEFKTHVHHRNEIRWYLGKVDNDDETSHKILVLGDSFAMGWGVGGHQTFSAIIEKNNPGIRVDNMAVSSYGLPRELMLLHRVLSKQTYDLIIIQYSGNDLGEVLRMVNKGNVYYENYEFRQSKGFDVETLKKRFHIRVADKILHMTPDRLVKYFYKNIGISRLTKKIYGNMSHIWTEQTT
jgi:hypothetical protein